jgi:hypothetical protein
MVDGVQMSESVNGFAPRLARVVDDLRAMLSMPRIRIALMHEQTSGNDPFYERIVREFFESATRPHPKYKVLPAMRYGVACCVLAGESRAYQALIESSGRRNYKKAVRLGYSFRRIDFNDHLDAVARIRRSTDTRQGKVPDEFFDDVKPTNDPPSRSSVHDYPTFGVFFGDELRAYASCLVSGELMMVEHILGHADFVADGVVPMLLIEMIQYGQKQYPCVKFYCYGSFFGANPTMRRFKTKFGFVPHRVDWVLGS